VRTFLGLGPAPTFEQTVLLYPLVTLAHVCEEWRRFTRWAQRHGSPRYSRRQYVVTHLAAIALATSGALLVRAFPSGLATLAFIGLLFGPSIACSALFHIGASLLTRRYCPGVVTSVVLYLPVALLILSRSTVAATMLRRSLPIPAARVSKPSGSSRKSLKCPRGDRLGSAGANTDGLLGWGTYDTLAALQTSQLS
jgi:Protein of unknown function with HXXEE motif